MCPSGSDLSIPLGLTNPQSTIVAEETLIFRRRCFSHRLWLLVPTFLLCNAPGWVTPFPSSRCKHSPTAKTIPKNWLTPSFGTMLEPRLFVAQSLSMSELLRYLSRIAASKQTSSLSSKLYSLTCTEHRFRDLKYGSGLFPFWPVELRPHGLTATFLTLRIRSLIEFARLLPVELFQCSTPKRNTWR